MILNFWQNARPTTTALWTKSFPKMANFFMSVCAKINFTMLWKRENKNKLLFVSNVRNLLLFKPILVTVVLEDAAVLLNALALLVWTFSRSALQTAGSCQFDLGLFILWLVLHWVSWSSPCAIYLHFTTFYTYCSEIGSSWTSESTLYFWIIF